MKFTYHEPFLSKIIYISRKLYFDTINVRKLFLKKISNIKEWCFKDYKFKIEHIKSKAKNHTKNTRKKVQQTKIPLILSSNLNPRLAVYTCIYGPYDMICEPIIKGKYCDYYIITDQQVKKSSVWKKIEPQLPKDFNNWNDSVKNRYFKMHPEVIFPEYDYSLYIDGNIILLTDVYPLLKNLESKFIGIFKHPLTDCFYQSAESLKQICLVNPEESDRQVKYYSKCGFPEHYGYFECSLLLRQHNNPQCKKLMDTWWDQYLTYVKRDQQSIMFSLWINGFNKEDVACLGPNIRRHPRFYFKEHKKKHSLVESIYK